MQTLIRSLHILWQCCSRLSRSPPLTADVEKRDPFLCYRDHCIPGNPPSLGTNLVLRTILVRCVADEMLVFLKMRNKCHACSRASTHRQGSVYDASECRMYTESTIERLHCAWSNCSHTSWWIGSRLGAGFDSERRSEANTGLRSN